MKKEIIQDFHAPFVKDSAVKIGMKYLDSISLPNGCYLVIGSVELIICPDEVINELGQLNLGTYKCVGISGLNSYYALNMLETFPFVRTHEIPDFK